MASPLDATLTSALGERQAKLFAKAFGYVTVGELLAHYPRRYARRGELTAIEELAIGESVSLVAEVRSVTERRMQNRKGTITEASITDGHGILTLTWFNQPYRARDLKPGIRGIFSGKIGAYRGVRQLAHPDYELFEPDAVVEGGEPDPDAARRWVEAPVPIYPSTSTLATWQIARVLKELLEWVAAAGGVVDPVPDEVRASRGLVTFAQALQLVHAPEKDADWQRARDALRFQEAFVLQVALLRQRADRRAEAATPRVPGALSAELDAALPFTLTGDQQRVGDEIARELADGAPMNRLVQGEVGSGKTLVALRAMMTVADSGGQSAFLAPTEVLAGQHLRSIVATLGPDLAARLRVTLVTGQLSVPERRKALLAAASGGARIVVGTHALLGDKVQFADLGLVVVDEQHRFGVDQREALRLKGQAPHVLVLTATPIPRTVAMTVFGDLDISTIAELPAGRSPITSHVVGLAEHPGWESRIWERLAEELAQGRQGFVVCSAIDAAGGLEEGSTAVDESESTVGGQAGAGQTGTGRPAADTDTDPTAGDRAGAGDPSTSSGPALPPGSQPPSLPPVPPRAVEDVLEEVRANPALAGRRIEPLHGRMSSEQKDATMRAFSAGEIDVLVATTVIEVGVDVPNASTMVVLDADRFGVAQLHQLRGRVGRGSVPGLALFVTRAELGSLARDRVEAVAATLDGFELAQADLELRREGDVLGGAQSGGRSSLRLLRVVSDAELIAEARSLAAGVLEADPGLKSHAALREALDRRLDAAEREYLAKG